MDRRKFTLKGLALVPAAGSLLVAARADARKKKRKHRPKPRPTSPRTPVALTQTFSNRSLIRLVDHAPANPYPSTILVSGLTNVRILDLNLVLHELSHDRPFDAAVMLVSPSGTGVVVMHNVGGNLQVIDVVITIDDQAPVYMPDEPDAKITTGAYKPTNYGSISGLFPPPAPQTGVGLDLADFNDENPNGEWKLFVVDDSPLIGGVFATGWSLNLTYEVPAPKTAEAPEAETSEAASPQEAKRAALAASAPGFRGLLDRTHRVRQVTHPPGTIPTGELTYAIPTNYPQARTRSQRL